MTSKLVSTWHVSITHVTTEGVRPFAAHAHTKHSHSRVVRYGMVGYSLAYTLYNGDSPMMFYTGCLVLGLMGIMNTLFFVDAVGAPRLDVSHCLFLSEP